MSPDRPPRPPGSHRLPWTRLRPRRLRPPWKHKSYRRLRRLRLLLLLLLRLLLLLLLRLLLLLLLLLRLRLRLRLRLLLCEPFQQPLLRLHLLLQRLQCRRLLLLRRFGCHRCTLRRPRYCRRQCCPSATAAVRREGAEERA